jgi:hypothetical protein
MNKDDVWSIWKGSFGCEDLWAYSNLISVKLRQLLMLASG